MDKSKSYSIFEAQNLPLLKWMHFENFENQFWQLVEKKWFENQFYQNNTTILRIMYEYAQLSTNNDSRYAISLMHVQNKFLKNFFQNENNKHATHKR